MRNQAEREWLTWRQVCKRTQETLCGGTPTTADVWPADAADAIRDNWVGLCQRCAERNVKNVRGVKNVLDGGEPARYDRAMSDATTGAALVDNPYLVLAHLCDREGVAWVVQTLAEACAAASMASDGGGLTSRGACSAAAEKLSRAVRADLTAVEAACGHR